eukprot:gene15827-33381_t
MKIIETTNISKRYIMGSEIIDALKSVTISVDKGEYVAFMGPSGSGKSTLMNIIGCLDSPTGGKYVLNNHDVSSMSENELAEIRNKEIGFVFQTFNLLPRQSALENVALPLIYAGYTKSQRTEKAMLTLKNVGLDNRAHHKPNELSGGQRQRVAIARALVNDPSILLADEPTGNLDTKTSYEIMELFDQLYSKGNTIVMVTHEEDIAKYSHRIIRLRDGLLESDRINPEPTNPREMAKLYAQKVKDTLSFAQSPAVSAESANVKVTYGQPSKKGRVIFGGLEKFGTIWRTGANGATEITFKKDVKFGGKSVKAGTYSLFSKLGEKEWTIILNSELKQWGAYGYDKIKDKNVVEVTVPVKALKDVVEKLTISTDDKTLTISWDTTSVAVPMEF